jgi:hypothetical protein
VGTGATEWLVVGWHFEVILPESRCITEESMPEVKDGKISGAYPFTNRIRNVGAYQIQGHEAF